MSCYFFFSICFRHVACVGPVGTTQIPGKSQTAGKHLGQTGYKLGASKSDHSPFNTGLLARLATVLNYYLLWSDQVKMKQVNHANHARIKLTHNIGFLSRFFIVKLYSAHRTIIFLTAMSATSTSASLFHTSSQKILIFSSLGLKMNLIYSAIFSKFYFTECLL